MTMFQTESELIATLKEIEASLSLAANGTLEEFRGHYDQAVHLYGYQAVDGHESDGEELLMLKKHGMRISKIEKALNAAENICAESDAGKEAYIKAGRYGASEAQGRIRKELDEQG